MSVIEEIAAERDRQIMSEGWDWSHDDQHADGSLAIAAACYAIQGNDLRYRVMPDAWGPKAGGVYGWLYWPWEWVWWKPGARRRNLIKAGALIVAEIERLDRAGASS